jgi:hypothetical protein
MNGIGHLPFRYLDFLGVYIIAIFYNRKYENELVSTLKCKLKGDQLLVIELLNICIELVFPGFLYYFKYCTKFRSQIFVCI